MGKIQFHSFPESEKYSNSKESDKNKKLANTLIILKNNVIPC